jgi:hypothetical protein
MYSEPKPKFARLPANGTWCQRHYAVGRSTNTDCHALECPVGTLEAHPVCSIPESKSMSMSTLYTKTRPIAVGLSSWTRGHAVGIGIDGEETGCTSDGREGHSGGQAVDPSRSCGAPGVDLAAYKTGTPTAFLCRARPGLRLSGGASCSRLAARVRYREKQTPS